jgi:hypothetical protein
MPAEFADFIAAARDAARKSRARGARTRSERAAAAAGVEASPPPAPAPAAASNGSAPHDDGAIPTAAELEQQVSRVSPTTA